MKDACCMLNVILSLLMALGPILARSTTGLILNTACIMEIKKASKSSTHPQCCLFLLARPIMLTTSNWQSQVSALSAGESAIHRKSVTGRVSARFARETSKERNPTPAWIWWTLVRNQRANVQPSELRLCMSPLDSLLMPNTKSTLLELWPSLLWWSKQLLTDFLTYDLSRKTFFCFIFNLPLLSALAL